MTSKKDRANGPGFSANTRTALRSKASSATPIHLRCDSASRFSLRCLRYSASRGSGEYPRVRFAGFFPRAIASSAPSAASITSSELW
eukprot:1904937-Pleurochrysis_carterae.AAC.2